MTSVPKGNSIPAAITLVVLLTILTGCSQEDAKSSSQKTSAPLEGKLAKIGSPSLEQELTLTDIPKPNASAMDADVAAVVTRGWQALVDTLATENLTQEARAQAYATYGLTAFGNGLAIPAETAFKNATLLAPEDARWLYFLALMYQYNGKLDDAAYNFIRVLDISPDNLPTLLRLGKVRFEQASMLAAKNLYQRVLELDDQNAAAHYGLGRVASANEDYIDAINYFEKALSLQPQADRIHYFLGIAWRNLGETEKAKSNLAKHGSNEPQFADSLFDEISGGESRIDGLWAHMNAGSQAFVEGEYALAVEEFKLATSDLPNDSRSWQSLGMALNKNGDTEQSIRAYNKALSLSKNNAVIHHELGKLLMATGVAKEAETHLQKAIQFDPRMLQAHITLAQLKYDSGLLEEALKHYEDALILDPQSSEVEISRAQVLVALGKTDIAVAALEQAVKFDPRDANLRMAYGLALADADQLDKAQAEVKRALSDTENDISLAQAHVALGQIHIRRGDPELAIISFGSALRINPRDRVAALELARTFIRLKDYAQALGTYEVLLKNWPNDDPARIEAARVSVMQGNGLKARTILEEGTRENTASARLLGSLARLLVLATEPDVKDSELALKYAQSALKQNKAFHHQETLALCYAGTGRFEDAIEVQERLVREAGPKSTPRVTARMEKNLARYRSKNLGRLPFDAS